MMDRRGGIAFSSIVVRDGSIPRALAIAQLTPMQVDYDARHDVYVYWGWSPLFPAIAESAMAPVYQPDEVLKFVARTEGGEPA